jgi:hypothetical protein
MAILKITGVVLECEYRDHDNEECEAYPRSEWKDQILNDGTKLGYDAWVTHQLNEHYGD